MVVSIFETKPDLFLGGIRKTVIFSLILSRKLFIISDLGCIMSLFSLSRFIVKKNNVATRKVLNSNFYLKPVHLILFKLEG